MLRAQPLTSTYVHSCTNRSHSLVHSIQHCSERRLAFGSDNMLSDCSNFKRGPGDITTFQSKHSESIAGRLAVNS